MTDICATCRGGQYLVEKMAELGCEIHAQPYNVFLNHNTGYETWIYECPGCHVKWWIEPTNDQKLAWARDGVR